MSLWVDKFRPSSFDDFDLHKSIKESMKKITDMDDFPHILLYGPPGSGKKTIFSCLITGLYGTTKINCKCVNMNFEAPSGKKFSIDVLSSPYHIQVNPSDVGVYDRVVIQELIKETAQTFQVNAEIRKRFKVILIVEADNLTKDAQHALRRTMEKYAASCRIVLISQSLSSIIDPIQSRCLCVRVPLPSKSEINTIFDKISHKLKFDIDSELVDKIYEQTQGNIRRSLLILENCKPQFPNNGNWEIDKPSWEIHIKSIADSIISAQTPQMLIEIREKFYELLSRCIPTTIIIKYLMKYILEYCDDELKFETIYLAAEYQYRLIKGSTPIIHLEAFVANFMSIYAKRNKSKK